MRKSFYVPKEEKGPEWRKLYQTIHTFEEEDILVRFVPGMIESGMVAPVYADQGEGIGPVLMYWSFPVIGKLPVVDVAPAERVREMSLFGRALRERRAAVPASGFFLSDQEGAIGRERQCFFDLEGATLYLAALYTVFHEQDGEKPCFCLVTTGANQSVAPYGKRMPVLLRAEERDAWVAGEEIGAFLGRVPFDLQVAELGQAEMRM